MSGIACRRDMTLLGDWSRPTAFQLNTALDSNASKVPALGRSLHLGDGRVQLMVTGGVLGDPYVLLASTNLVDRIPVRGYVFTNSLMAILDPDAANFPWRFFRIGPLAAAPAATIGMVSSQSPQPPGNPGFRLTLATLPGLPYRIEASTDLVEWVTVTNFFSPNPTVLVTDSNSAQFPQRFYRLQMDR